jgi:uncharacterized protein (TIGR02466 family)
MRRTHHDLFPTRVWVVDLTGPDFDAAALAEAVLALRRADPVARNRSTRNGWSGDRALFERPEFAGLRAACERAFAAALAESGQPGASFRLVAWANVHDRGGFNRSHVHRRALMSGTVYLSVPPGSGPLVFRDPRPGVQLTGAEGAFPNALAPIAYDPAVGQLLLFPSWLEHGVEEHQSDVPRISIAINADPA